MKKRWMIFSVFWLIILLATVNADNARICANIAGGYDAMLEEGKEAFFSFRVYNITTEYGAYCLPAVYTVRVWMEEKEVSDYFEYSLTTEMMALNGGENERTLLKLELKPDRPKPETGREGYKVFVTATREPETGGGSVAIYYEATGKVDVIVGTEMDEEYAEVPFWTMRKDCPDGAVVKEGEECPEPKKVPKAISATGLAGLLEGMDKGIIFTVVGLVIGGCIGLFAVYRHYTRKTYHEEYY